MPSNITTTQKMLKYASANKIDSGNPSTTNPLWGLGKARLAWRVSGHMRKHGKKITQSARKTDQLVACLFPDLVPAIHILHPDYKWNGAPVARRTWRVLPPIPRRRPPNRRLASSKTRHGRQPPSAARIVNESAKAAAAETLGTAKTTAEDLAATTSNYQLQTLWGVATGFVNKLALPVIAVILTLWVTGKL